MIIELFGLPGAGKTTFANNQDENKFTFIKSSNYNFFKKTKVILKYPIIFYWFKEVILDAIYSNKLILVRFKFALIIQTFCIFDLSEKLEKQTNKNIIMDEGFLQRILSVYEKKKSIKHLEKFLKNIKTDKIIVIKSDLEKFRRYKQENNPRKKLGEKYLENWFHVVKTNYENLLLIIEKSNLFYEIIYNNVRK